MLADELRRFTITLTIRPDGDLIAVAVSIELPDWDVLDDYHRDVRLYEWSCVIAVPLVTGELRRGWAAGSHDDARLPDNSPGASVRVPAGELPSPCRARVGGELVFERGPRIAWEQEIEAGRATLALVDERPPIARVEPHAVRAVEVAVRPIPMADANPWVVACLPERGLVTLSRTDGYALHTPTGVRALPELTRAVAELPGVEIASREHRGGPRGRLAIARTLSGGPGEHVVVVELDDHSMRVLYERDGTTLTRGGFDASGTYLLLRTRERRRIDATREDVWSWTQVLDCDAGQLLDWRGPDANLNGRWQLDGDLLAGADDSELHVVPRAGPPSSTRVWVDAGRYPNSAWHPASGVAVWAEHERGLSLPPAVHCYHPSWGIRSFALSTAGEAVAVLRDGRIVVAADRLLVVDPARDEIVDLGALDSYTGELLDVIETDNAAILWTISPAQWRVELPAR